MGGGGKQWCRLRVYVAAMPAGTGFDSTLQQMLFLGCVSFYIKRRISSNGIIIHNSCLKWEINSISLAIWYHQTDANTHKRYLYLQSCSDLQKCLWHWLRKHLRNLSLPASSSIRKHSHIHFIEKYFLWKWPVTDVLNIRSSLPLAEMCVLSQLSTATTTELDFWNLHRILSLKPP